MVQVQACALKLQIAEILHSSDCPWPVGPFSDVLESVAGTQVASQEVDMGQVHNGIDL